MKGCTIQGSIDRLEKIVGDGSGSGTSGGGSAGDITYDNTESGLSSTTVQGAIDELDGELDALTTTVGNIPVNEYSTTEQIIGKWIDERPIYQKVFEVETAISLSSGLWTDLTGVDNTGMDVVLGVEIFQVDTGEIVCSMPVAGYVGTTVVKGLSFRSTTTVGVGSLIAVRYIKPVPSNSTRSKKK